MGPSRRFRQIGAALSERDHQTAVDDPDFLDVGGNEIWQKPVQRHHECRRFFELDEILRKTALDESEEKQRDREASGRCTMKRNANRRSVRADLGDVDGEWNGDELPDRSFDPQQSVEEAKVDLPCWDGIANTRKPSGGK